MKKLIIPSSIITVFIFIVAAIIILSARKSNTSNTQNVSTANLSIQVSYKDGDYMGDPFVNEYGTEQAEVIVANSKITDVKVIQAPNDMPRSQLINNNASPILSKEVITSQTANVDIISGATQSSRSFIQSVDSALKKAQ